MLPLATRCSQTQRMGNQYLDRFQSSHYDPEEKKCICLDCGTLICYMFEVIRNDYQCQSGKAYFVAQV